MDKLATLTKDAWAMEPRALELFLARVHDAGAAAAAELLAGPASPAAPRKSRMSIDAAGTATIPVTGVLLKTAPAFLREWGFDVTGYDEIVEDMKSAMADDGVQSIRLHVASPGGQVAGVKEAADAIFAARGRKGVYADVEDMAASAAYWLASQADAITAGPNAQVGSIGVYAAYYDASKRMDEAGIKVHVIASGAHKGMGVWGAPITEEQIKAQREVIDGMADNFTADVARGRGRSKAQASEWATGRVWLAAEALRLGLVDAVGPMKQQSTSPDVPAAADLSQGESMTPEQEKAAAAQAKAVEDAKAAERQLLKDLKAAFPKDSAFAVEQWEKGATVAQAKAAYADVLAERNEKLETDKADLQKKLDAKAVTRGADPVLQDDVDPAAGGADFMVEAAALAEKKKIKLREAMSELAAAKPELHAAYVAKLRREAPERNARLKAAMARR